MKKVIIWGTGEVGRCAFESLKRVYDIVSWADRDIYKVGLNYHGIPIIDVEQLCNMYRDVNVVIALKDYYEQYMILSSMGLKILGYFDSKTNTIKECRIANWENIINAEHIYLYAGDLCSERRWQFPEEMVCLSITRENEYTLLHDVTKPMPLKDDSVDFYQSEHVFEHIVVDLVVNILNEIYRVLKKGGYLRLSLPDYNNPFMKERCFCDSNGEIVFDPTGGGQYIEGEVQNGGHMWFPTIEKVIDIINCSNFSEYKCYRYYMSDGSNKSEPIDYTRGYVIRTKEFDVSYQDKSIVVDLFK